MVSSQASSLKAAHDIKPPNTGLDTPISG